MPNPMSLDRYACFCAPTTLAALMGISRLEAAEYLTAEGCNDGTGGTAEWARILEGLGGEKVETSTPEDLERWQRARGEYLHGLRYTNPKWTLRFPTVAEFLRRHPEGTYVLWSYSHTLLARDGEVVADTKNTRSQRCRVKTAYRFRELEQ